MPHEPLDPVDLTARLIRCPSVTPEEGGALQLLETELAAAGFTCTRVDRAGVPNLFAHWGEKGANRALGFNGHTDVVPVGDPADWTRDPFGGEIEGGRIWGRGACDMKSGVAAFVAAAVDFVRETPPQGAVILTVTGDEEGTSTDGTVAVLDWMEETGERMTHCVVGEPTCPEFMGQMIKNGRRGAMSATIVARGVQGHSAYPHLAKNPLHGLVALLDKLATHELDRGSEGFHPTTLALTTIDTGNPASNVIPATARAVLNIRFNDHHSGASLADWLKAEAQAASAASGIDFQVDTRISGEPFVTEPGEFTDLVAAAVTAECGVDPILSTSGGTSDARFIRRHCEVVEFGLVGKSMHQVDEYAEVADIHKLKAVYRRLLQDYFA
ncbi:succinyl-diaminopimelate desuccinylase [Pararhodobacter sp. SW119]|uniref:succinyl-diaminopimelate desuccinylase n=1 Tax=Pararhodobacter sp. SW119 TaxID=2780075 RepID=UPI001ADF13CF|nr:succinyl-diaminopimelate desuccinylase [Pararhodobacter sp. SW119]